MPLEACVHCAAEDEYNSKLVIESRDCRDKLRGGGTFTFLHSSCRNLSHSNSQAKSSYDNQPKGKESLLVEPKHSQKQSKTNSTETNLDSNQGLLLAPQPLRTASRSTKLLTALQGFKLNLTLLLRSLLLSCEENYL